MSEKKKYIRKFRKEWLDNEKLNDWLVEIPGNPQHAGCKYCECVLNVRLSDLLHHSKTRKHLRRALNPWYLEAPSNTVMSELQVEPVKRKQTCGSRVKGLGQEINGKKKTSSVPPKKRIIEVIEEEEEEEKGETKISKIVYTSCEPITDESEAFGQLVGTKMLAVKDPEQRYIAESIILKIIKLAIERKLTEFTDVREPIHLGPELMSAVLNTEVEASKETKTHASESVETHASESIETHASESVEIQLSNIESSVDGKSADCTVIRGPNQLKPDSVKGQIYSGPKQTYSDPFVSAVPRTETQPSKIKNAVDGMFTNFNGIKAIVHSRATDMRTTIRSGPEQTCARSFSVISNKTQTSKIKKAVDGRLIDFVSVKRPFHLKPKSP